MGKKWPRDILLDRLRARRDAGKSLCYTQIGQDDPLLRYNLRKFRGGWAGALQIIGEDPSHCRPYRCWTKEAILVEIRRRALAGTLASQRVVKEDGSLFRGARKLFGSWTDAIKAAGLCPPNYLRRRPRRRWTPESVKAAIAKYVADGLPTKAKNMCKADSGLYAAACLLFGSWKCALDPKSAPVRYPRLPTKLDDIVAAVRARHAQGLPINQSRMQPRSYICVANQRGKTWSEILQAAGFDPETINLHKKWSAEKVGNAIRKRVASGKPSNSSAVRRGEHSDPKLYEASMHYFGSWDNGLRAAGIDPASVRLRRRWSQKTVISEIRWLANAGAALKCADLRTKKDCLIQAAVRHFGSWPQALDAAGVEIPRRHLQWTRSKVIHALRRHDLSLQSFALLPQSLGNSAVRLFGSWKAALRAAFGNRADSMMSFPKPRGGRRFKKQDPI